MIKSRVVLGLMLFLLSSVSYSHTLKGALVYDDSEMVLENRNITGKTTLFQIFFDRQVMAFSGEIYRPLRDISYRIDYLIGGKEPFVYHVSNVLLHALTAIVAYWFLLLLLKGGPVPLLAAAFFAIHPLHTESVAWVKGRDDILFTLFYLLSFGMYLIYEKCAGLKGRFYYIASVFLFVLSLFSKEMAVTLPLAILIYKIIFNRSQRLDLLPFFILAIMYMALRTYVLGQVAQQEYWGGGPIPTMLTMIKGVAQYVRLCLLPINQCADYFSFPISDGLDSGVAFATIFLLLVVVLLFVAGDKLILYGGLLFFVTLLPVLNIIPIKILIAERFLYLPLLGFCIVSTSLLLKISSEKVMNVIGWAIISIFFVLTFQRGQVWNNEHSLWFDTLKKAPMNPRAHYGIGTAYASKGMLDEAIKEYLEAIRLAPYNPESYNSLGLAYYKKGVVKEAVELYKKALELDSGHRDARYNLALLYHEKGEVDQGIKEYKEVLSRFPEDLDALNSLGLAYFQKGMFQEAIVQYKKALEVHRESVAPYNNIGMAYAVIGWPIEAEKWFRRALMIDPKSAEAYYNLGFMYQNLGSLNEAGGYYKKTLEVRPDYKEARERLMELDKGIKR